jgi:diguanylate cyclase (GGDEF)-like protein
MPHSTARRRSRKAKSILTALPLILLAHAAHAQQPLALTEGRASYSLDGHLAILEDPSGGLDFQAVSSGAYSFAPVHGDAPILGFTHSVYWARFSVRNDTENPNWILEYSYPLTNIIELYVVNISGGGAGGGDVQRSGNSLPLSQRVIPSRTFPFHLMIPPGGTVECFMRVRTDSTLIFALKIWKPEFFTFSDSQSLFVLGMLFGLMAIMALYNLLIFLSSKERAYLHFVVFVIAYGFLHLCYTGLASLYFWPESVWWAGRSLVFFASLSVAFGITFAQEFLQTRKWAPWVHRIFWAFLMVAIGTAIAAFFIPYSLGILITNRMLIAIAVYGAFAAVVVYAKGNLSARFYLLAWGALIVAMITVALKDSRVIPHTPFTANILQIGSVAQVILFSLAIADRINIMRGDKERAERDELASRQKLIEATEERLYKDGLTGFPNRNSLLVDIAEKGCHALFIVNVDHFKELNAFYGNRIGDLVIIELGKRIREAASSPTVSIYKLHADEFALVSTRPLSREELVNTGVRLVEACQEEPYRIGDRVIRVDVSTGISGDGEGALEKADIALTQSRLIRREFLIYDPSMATVKQFENNLNWIDTIREALREGRIFPYYQAIMSNTSNRIEKYECLMRMQKRDGTVISPSEFLPYAKKSRMYPELSRVIIGKSCAQFSGSDLEFSINLLIDDITDANTVSFINNCIDTYGVGPRLVFEILESEGIESYPQVSKFIEDMKGHGCRVAIDDFGAGYSNFEHTLRLNVDYLKIDSSLIKNIHTDFHSHFIVDTIVAFSRKLGIKTIAEYVHCAEVYQRVKEIGVDYSQGFFIGTPSERL